MRSRLHHLSPAVLFILLAATLLVRVLPANEELVWVTPSGSRYHRQSCRHAAKARAVPLSQAREQGLLPCSLCFTAEEVAMRSQAREIRARVVGVSDGDTITVLEGKMRYTLRLYGIDAPESGQAFGRQAKAFLSSVVFGKELRVELIEKDRYGRWVANIYDGSIWVNRAIVEAGYAWHYRNYSNSKDLQEAENKARSEGRGLWRDKMPQAPWDWRKHKQ